VPASREPFDLAVGVVELARAIVDVESVSGNEELLADRIEETLRIANHLDVVRHGNTVAARINRDAPVRVIIAGHLDTVPVSGLLPARRENGRLWGRGAVDMKGGVACQLLAACELKSPRVDVTWIFYDQEEVESERNGLGHFATAHPEWMKADFAVLGEPSNAGVEGGCNGTLRIELRAKGTAAHSARPWMGHNAIHALSAALQTLSTFESETREVEGLSYRESLSAVGVSGGTAGNVIPDSATLTVNFRFAPDRTVDEAIRYVTNLFPDLEAVVVDQSPGARPGLNHPLAQSLVASSGGEAAPKYGWTDVARFSQLGIPAVNFGPGDAQRAHSPDEWVEESEIELAYNTLREWLSPS
jgi:succinyl-diaminopimelate desuccinylase